MISFQSLWDNHPAPKTINPCVNEKGHSNFENQCAIRMGVALNLVKISLQGTRRCWFKGHVGHVLAAEELGRWLDERPSLVGKTQKLRPGKDALPKVTGKKGILMCMNFWGTGNRGDHIDVWDGSKMKHGRSDYITASEEVWFWELP